MRSGLGTAAFITPKVAAVSIVSSGPPSLDEAANRMDERPKRSTHYPKHVLAGSAANLVLSV